MDADEHRSGRAADDGRYGRARANHASSVTRIAIQAEGGRAGRKDFLGLALQANNIGERELARIIKAAGVRRITFHGLRHTSATLMLKAGVAAHVVQLGHKRIEMTLAIYAHALPSMQQDAARRLGALLHG